MEIYESASALIHSMRAFERASLGDSNDAEHSAAVLMQSEAKALVKQLAVNEPRLSELLNQSEANVAQIGAKAFDAN
jgi:hypothetical protein